MLQLLSTLIILDVVHAKDQFEALVLHVRLMLVIVLMVQKLVRTAPMEEHRFPHRHDVWVVESCHNVKALDLFHAGVDVLSVPFTAVDSFVLGYLKAIGRIRIYRYKFPRLFFAIHLDLIDTAKSPLAQKV